MGAVDSVRHDAAALCWFVDQVAGRCSIASSPSYTESSKDFFVYIAALGEATKKHLADYVDGLDPLASQNDPDSFYTSAQQIRTLRFSWFQLHQFVQPALDADTLQVPFTLVQALTDRVREIKGFDCARFAVVHTSDLSYFQVTSTYIQNLAAQIGSSISGAPPFPDNLGLIGIPYSQSSSLFLNTALAHEMGHFVFDKRNESSTLFPEVLKALNSSPTLAGMLGGSIPPTGLDIQSCVDTCMGWLTEIYCDLFAILLSGPAFSLAYVELFSLSRVRRAVVSGSQSSPLYSQLEFSESHPANAVRLRQHVYFMQRPSINWWNEIVASTSSHAELLRESQAIQDSALSLDPRANSPINRAALEAFLIVLPRVHEVVEDAFAGVDIGLNSFQNQKTSIQKYISFGVVPSRLVNGEIVTSPSTIALLNSAHLFYLDDFTILLDRITSAHSSCLTCRAHWAQQIEMWTTKALEDVGHGYTVS